MTMPHNFPSTLLGELTQSRGWNQRLSCLATPLLLNMLITEACWLRMCAITTTLRRLEHQGERAARNFTDCPGKERSEVGSQRQGHYVPLLMMMIGRLVWHVQVWHTHTHTYTPVPPSWMNSLSIRLAQLLPVQITAEPCASHLITESLLMNPRLF